MNFKVIVTRPLPVAKQLCHLITASGGQAYSCPVFNIVNLLPPIERQDLKQYQHCVFLSMPAVLGAQQCIKKLLTLSVLPCFWAIGPATKEKLLSLNVSNVHIPCDFSSEGLAKLLKRELVPGQKSAVFCGQDGREYLFKSLNALGHQADPIYVYKREAKLNLVHSIRSLTQRNGKRIVVVSTSLFGLELFIKAVKQLSVIEQSVFMEAPLVVVSLRMGQQARKCWFNQYIIVAKGMSNDAIVEALLTIGSN